MVRKRQVTKTEASPVIDPRRGDIEDDASSTKRRSMLSLAGSLLVEISLPKLIFAWAVLLVLPGLLLGLAPIVFAEWLTIVTDKITSLVLGLWSLLLFGGVIALGWFGWRALLRMTEKNFWFVRSLQSLSGRAILMHGHRHIDWIGECAGLPIVSAPSPVMEATDDMDTYFYIHTLAVGADGRLRLLTPERMNVAGTPATDA